jgi:hypothetical protein
MVDSIKTCWDNTINQRVEKPQKMIDFFDEIESICKKYNMSISHEDTHGLFEIEEYSESNIEWLRQAHKSY